MELGVLDGDGRLACQPRKKVPILLGKLAGTSIADAQGSYHPIPRLQGHSERHPHVLGFDPGAGKGATFGLMLCDWGRAGPKRA